MISSVMKKLIALLPLLMAAVTTSAITVTFEDLTVPAAGYYVGQDSASSFTSDGVTFLVNYNSTYSSWDGIGYAYNTYVTPTASSYSDEYAMYEASGVSNTADTSKYAVVYDPGAYGSSPEVDLPDGLDTPRSMEVTNNAYVWATLTYGDSYGMVTAFTTGDWYLLTITGYDSSDTATGSTSVYLSDYTSSTASDHYILTDFTTVDLTALGTGVTKIKFVVSASQTSTYSGVTYLDVPSYFLMDNLVVRGTYEWVTVDGWNSTWYGAVYAYQHGTGWIYSWDNHAFQYFAGTATGCWVYDYDLGWYWTSEDFYPYIYLLDYSTWAYFYKGSGTDSTTRWYYLYNDAYSSISTYPYAKVSDLTTMSINN
jgi:hypothetical protein